MAQHPACSFGEGSSEYRFHSFLKHCCTAFACTATHTATPTNSSDKKQHTTDRKEPFQAQEGHGRTPVNNVCRVPPSAVPSFYFEPRHHSSQAIRGLSHFYCYLCTATIQQRQQSTGIHFQTIPKEKRLFQGVLKDFI